MVLELSYSVVLNGWVTGIYIENKAIGTIDIYEYINRSDIPVELLIYLSPLIDKNSFCVYT